MNHRIVWPLTALLGAGVLAWSLSGVTAQGPGMMPPYGYGGQTGRFVVAHAAEKQIVILDTTSGQLYAATPDDFKKHTELPKIGMPNYPMPSTDKDKRPLFGKDKGPREVEKKDVETKDKSKDK